MELATVYEPSFANLEDAAIILTPYATAYRYPGESNVMEPSRAEFNEAFELEASLVSFVFLQLPGEVRPKSRGTDH